MEVEVLHVGEQFLVVSKGIHVYFDPGIWIHYLGHYSVQFDPYFIGLGNFQAFDSDFWVVSFMISAFNAMLCVNILSRTFDQCFLINFLQI